MSLSRTDKLTGSTRNTEFFSDFLDSFAVTPFGNQLARTINEKAVIQSLKNIIKTNRGERFFQPNLGSDVYKSLFEMNDFMTESALELYVETAIRNHEPRVHLSSVTVRRDEIDENLMNIRIVFFIINNTEPLDITVVLKRVR